jgi:hypothetical protein
MKRLFVFTFICVSFSAFTQSLPNPFKKKAPWHNGTVVLHTGDTITGPVKFTRKVSEGLLQMKKGRQVKVLTVKDVLSFSYYDKKKKKTRKYLTLSLLPELATREHEIFIEYIYGNNKLSLLNYKALGFSDQALQINPFRTKTVVNKRYLLDNKTGKILPLTKENVLELMDEEKKEVMTYIHSSGMRLKTVEDYISLLDYHQSLIAGL